VRGQHVQLRPCLVAHTGSGGVSRLERCTQSAVLTHLVKLGFHRAEEHHVGDLLQRGVAAPHKWRAGCAVTHSRGSQRELLLCVLIRRTERPSWSARHTRTHGHTHTPAVQLHPRLAQSQCGQQGGTHSPQLQLRRVVHARKQLRHLLQRQLGVECRAEEDSALLPVAARPASKGFQLVCLHRCFASKDEVLVYCLASSDAPTTLTQSANSRSRWAVLSPRLKPAAGLGTSSIPLWRGAGRGPLRLLPFVQRRGTCDRLSATRALRCKCHWAGDRAPLCRRRSCALPGTFQPG
jgi:hypothetical protein